MLPEAMVNDSRMLYKVPRAFLARKMSVVTVAGVFADSCPGSNWNTGCKVWASTTTAWPDVAV